MEETMHIHSHACIRDSSDKIPRVSGTPESWRFSETLASILNIPEALHLAALMRNTSTKYSRPLATSQSSISNVFSCHTVLHGALVLAPRSTECLRWGLGPPGASWASWRLLETPGPPGPSWGLRGLPGASRPRAKIPIPKTLGRSGILKIPEAPRAKKRVS